MQQQKACRKLKHIDISVVADDVKKQKVDYDNFEEEEQLGSF